MNYNDQMRLKLKSNIRVVLIFLGISVIVLGVTLYDIFFTNLLDVQTNLLIGQTFPIFFTGYGVLALLASIYAYYKFDNYYPQQQIVLFMLIGTIFSPFTIVLLVIGIMKYLEKSKFKPHFFGSFVLGFLVLGVVMSLVVTNLSAAQPEYLNEYVYTGIYTRDDNSSDTVEVTATALTRGDKVIKIIFEAEFNLDDPVTTVPNEQGNLVVSEGLRLSMNERPTCIIYAYDEAQVSETMTCELTTFPEEGSYSYTTSDFINFSEFNIEFGEIYDDLSINDVVEYGQLTITNETVRFNVYEEYLGTFTEE